VHASIWETVADTLFWLQLCWIFSGFLLMAYLALKVFPKSKPRDRDRSVTESVRPEAKNSGRAGRNELMTAGNYRLESFPQISIPAGRIIEFQSIISEQNRRLS
jgi:hypothetical protein